MFPQILLQLSEWREGMKEYENITDGDDIFLLKHGLLEEYLLVLSLTQIEVTYT